MIALHEAEHITQAKNRKAPFGESYPELSRTYVYEIDADYAALQALPPEDPIRDYWMQARQVISFSKNFSSPFGMEFDHDTATPIRIFEATGMLIDLRAFQEEKKI